MHCNSCGASLEPGARFCTTCGATVQQGANQQPTYQQPQQPIYQQPQQPVYQQPVYQQPQQPAYQPPYAPVPANLTWKEFYSRFVTKKGFVIWMAVICFFTAAMSLAILVTGNPLFIMDILVYVISGILLVSTKHWVGALIPTIYGGIFTVVNLALGGTPTGFVAVVVGIAATKTLAKANKAYQQYKLDGIVPTDPI